LGSRNSGLGKDQRAQIRDTKEGRVDGAREDSL